MNFKFNNYKNEKLFFLELRLLVIFLASFCFLDSCTFKPFFSQKNNTTKEQTNKSSNSTLNLAEDTDDEGDVFQDSKNAEKLQQENQSRKNNSNHKLATVFGHGGKVAKAYEINQRNDMLGPTKIILSSFGSRFDTDSLTCILPINNPAILYNPANEKKCPFSFETSLLFGSKKNANSKISKREIRKINEELIAGIPCIHYEIEQFSLDKDGKNPDREWKIELWSTKKLNLPDQVMNQFSRVLPFLPQDCGLPFKLVRHASPTRAERQRGIHGDQPKEFLLTVSVKQVDCHSDEFKYLDGYKQAKNQMEVLMSTSSNELSEMEDSLEELEKE